MGLGSLPSSATGGALCPLCPVLGALLLRYLTAKVSLVYAEKKRRADALPTRHFNTTKTLTHKELAPHTLPICPTRSSSLTAFGVPLHHLRPSRPLCLLQAPSCRTSATALLTCGLGHRLEKDTIPNAELQALLGRPEAVEAEVEDGEEVWR